MKDNFRKRLEPHEELEEALEGNEILQTMMLARLDGYCPCCGYNTLTEEDWATYSICPICKWEDAGDCFYNIDRVSGPNHISLREGIKNFQEIGAFNQDTESREPKSGENQHSNWPWGIEGS